ncbi:hypothetical protein ACFQ21_22540 [Ohtaekwangia kribbensis]|jgi:hypothetical protein|uniref:Uncharacterized protein n=1 Tax=Ohtaekwangia kribbensis TaxID=688913 RepID=A0ABW3KA82_9BACT
MEKTGFIEIGISGLQGNKEITPDNYDIKEIMLILENVENLLFPSDKKDRPVISYRIEQGSVKHIFKTSAQYIIGFNALLGQIRENNSIDFLDYPTAKAIEEFQAIATKKNYTLTLRTSISGTNEIQLNKDTRYLRTEAIWSEAEFYFYGRITNAGGKDRANMYLLTDDHGLLRIETPIEFLEKLEQNLLYKNHGVRVKGKQHSETGEFDKSSLSFIDLIDYEPKYDKEYLTSLRTKAKKNWLGSIDADSWLNEIRGNYES